MGGGGRVQRDRVPGVPWDSPLRRRTLTTTVVPGPGSNQLEGVVFLFVRLSDRPVQGFEGTKGLGGQKFLRVGFCGPESRRDH